MALSKNTQSAMVGVDIGSTSIKVLELSMKGAKICVESYAVHPLPKGLVEEKHIVSKDRLVEHLSRLLKGSKKASVAFAIPTNVSSSNTTKIEDIQATDRDLNHYIQTHAEALIPMNFAEASYDFISHIEEVDGKVRRYLNVVCAKTESVRQRAAIFESIGMVPKIATVESLAIQRVLPLITPFEGDGAYFLIDVGYSTTSTYLIKDNKILFDYEYGGGGNFLTQRIMQGEGVDYAKAEELKQQWLVEGLEEFNINYLDPYLDQISDYAQSGIQVALSSVSGAGVYDITGIVLMGGGSTCGDMAAKLEQRLGYKVRDIAPFEDVEFSPKVDRKKFAEDQSFLLPAFGLALMQFGPALNLLPWRDELSEAQQKSYISNAVISAMLGGLIVFGVWSYYKNELANHLNANQIVTTETQRINTKLEELREVTTLRDTMLERTKLIENLEAQRPTIVMINNLIVKAVPAEAYLTTYLREGMNYEFHGKAKDPLVVAAFMRNLKASPWFNEIFMSSFIAFKNKNEDGRPIQGDGYGEFVVTAKLKGLTYESVMGLTPDSITPSSVTIQSPTQERAEVAPETTSPVAAGGGGGINRTAPDNTLLNTSEVGAPPVSPAQGAPSIPVAGTPSDTGVPLVSSQNAASGG